jgi:predicted transcriptional regulator
MLFMELAYKDVRQRFRVVRLEEADICAKTDHFNELGRLILAHEPMYPEIARWFRDKVAPGVRTAERVAFIGYLNEKPAVSAVVKRGAVAKFCHLHVTEGLQNFHLGEVFFALMANEVRDLAQSIYFTLPESVWSSKKEFFRSFNFLNLHRANAQYRLFDEELECEASFAEIWKAVASKLPRICSLYANGEGCLGSDLVISIRPRHVEQIFAGKKRFELRRRFSTKWLGHRMNIYATEPAMQLVGQATVRSIIRNSPGEIWEKIGSELGCTLEDFERYTKGITEVYAIELDEIKAFRFPVCRKEIAEVLKESLVPPQSYCSLKRNNAWGKAVSIANLLQGAFSARIMNSLNSLLCEGKLMERSSPVLELQMRRLLY